MGRKWGELSPLRKITVSMLEAKWTLREMWVSGFSTVRVACSDQFGER